MASQDTLERLMRTIAERRTGDPDTSYVARLNARGTAKIAQKLGEEAVETVIAALAAPNDEQNEGQNDELIGEAADLLFHLLVLLDAKGVPLEAVLSELERREGTSGIAEKASRSR